MKYAEIFKKVKTGDTISLYQYSIEALLKKYPRYNEFCEEKIRLRREIEKTYKAKFVGRFSLRVFLEAAVHSVINKRRLNEQHLHCFGEESEKINNEIFQQIEGILLKYSSIPQQLIDFIWNSDNYINDVFSKINLKKHFKKAELKDLYMLKNGQIGLTLYFELNEQTKNIFINEVDDDWGEKIGYFQDASIDENGLEIFSSITHEDMYFYN